jgi:hypothetical protein
MTEAMEHPGWCDLVECTAGQRLSLHRSAPYLIDAVRLGDITIAVQLTSTADEPVTVAPVSVGLLMTRTDHASVEGYELDEPTVRRLFSVLGDVLPAMAC